MAKPVPSNTVRDPASGREVTLRGFGALKGRLALDPRIDLTKPIYEQVLALAAADKKR